MACPTCDGTMQALPASWFWCPRCGTLKNSKPNDFEVVDAPAIVTLVRNVIKDTKEWPHEPLLDARVDGMKQLVYKPEERES